MNDAIVIYGAIFLLIVIAGLWCWAWHSYYRESSKAKASP